MEVKNVVLNVKKNVSKVFTKSEKDIIIEKNYNPLNESEGLFMKEKNIILEEIEKGLSEQEKELLKEHTDICIKIYKKGIEKGFNANM